MLSGEHPSGSVPVDPIALSSYRSGNSTNSSGISSYSSGGGSSSGSSGASSSNRSRRTPSVYCDFCHMRGHLKEACYKLLQCSYCNMKGHTKETCYKLIGYPADYKEKRKVNAASAMPTQRQNNTAMQPYFTQDQYNQILRMLKKPMIQESTSNLGGGIHASNVTQADIDECIDRQPDYRCAKDAICQNTEGNYTCICPPDFSGNGTVCNRDNPQRITQNIYFVIGATAGVAFAIIIVFGWSYTAFQRRKMSKMKKKFFQENGGLVLQQRLTREEGSSHNNTIKIFTAEELEKATNGFDKDRVVGQGGFGTVYKGYLKDNCIVAIKKSKVIDRNQIEQFINEVLVLSQINHRNVVKLLGCCLETEVPLLVYEFISNGTLSEHLHDKLKASNLSLDIRLRVAAETAGVLSYLHSAAYPPIIHRDIKSVNILLDKSYTAKVSDFGASRLVPADQTELSTLVQGTLGYLDPEYLQTNQLNEKSDVYSFGVVLVELLTGRKALCFERPAEERSLAQYFISSVEKGLLLDILDDNIVYDKTNEEKLKNVVMLAQRCLNVKGGERPTMKEVAAELEAGLRLKHSWAETDRHSEEKESLLPGTQRLRFGYEYSEHSADADSITSHVTLPFPGGR
uniref:ATP binding protein n=1 Tax=Solanum tuberosum TaxID=4113 RepID=M1A7Y5_SOLTU